ncbi:MAG TPA: DUF5666 domain-containing protein [Burkholderiales bacterium]|nr:DUF5666 domain-containing protein [Burkholderiales bacterium]
MKNGIFALAVWTGLAVFGAPAASLAAPCSDPGGIGGTGIRADTGGTGGTGIRAEGGIGGTGARAEGGIGGTGIRADTDLGLIGVVTGFASICVNGVEVHYDTATPVTVNGQPASTAALALGQTVAVRAIGAATEARARSVAVIEAVAGPVTAVDQSAGSAQVFGQRVRLASSTVFGPGVTREAFGRIQAGETLRVSGLRTADGTIMATRIELAPAGAALAFGPLTRDASGALRIGGLQIDPRSPALAQLASAEGAVLVTGRAQNGRLVAEQVLTAPLAAALAPERFIVQAYVAEVRGERELRAGGLIFSVDPQLSAALAPNRLVRLSGHTEASSRHVVDRVEFLAEPLNPRPLGAAEAGARSSRSGGDDRRGRGESESGDDRRGGSGSEGPGGGDSSGRSGPSDRGSSGRPDRIDRPDRVDRPDRTDSHSGRH